MKRKMEMQLYLVREDKEKDIDKKGDKDGDKNEDGEVNGTQQDINGNGHGVEEKKDI